MRARKANVLVAIHPMITIAQSTVPALIQENPVREIERPTKTVSDQTRNPSRPNQAAGRATIPTGGGSESVSGPRLPDAFFVGELKLVTDHGRDDGRLRYRTEHTPDERVNG